MIRLIVANSLLCLLTTATLFTCWWLYSHRAALDAPVWAVPLLALGHTLVGLGCVKVFAALETLDLSKVENMSLFGAIFFLPVVYWLGAKLTKRSLAEVFDAFTPCVVFTLMCARFNCLLSGCCLGMYIPGTAGLRFPTRELELLFYGVLLVWLWKKNQGKEIPGLYYPVYMIAYGAFRFLTEGLRSSDSQKIIHISHLWAAVTFCLGLSIYFELKRKNQKRRKKNA